MTGIIDKAERCDLPEILRVQKAAFFPIAALLHKDTLPPLNYTLSDTEADYAKQLILKYTLDGRIAGSVRAYLDAQNICRIGKLVVLPAYQGRGIGKALMHTIHDHFSSCAAFELFTSKNIAYIVDFYQRLGYKEKYSEPFEGDILVFMERKNTSSSCKKQPE